MNKKVNLVSSIIMYVIAGLVLLFYFGIGFIAQMTEVSRSVLLGASSLFLYIGGGLLSKYLDNNKPMKINLYIFFGLYLILLITLTLFDSLWLRNGFNFSGFDNIQDRINLVPFKTIMTFVKEFDSMYSTSQIMLNLFGNVCAFMPMALFLPLLFKRQNKVFQFVITLTLMILGIEFLQLITGSGRFDIDDLILNLFGAVLVYLLFKIKSVNALIHNIFLLEKNKISKKYYIKIIFMNGLTGENMIEILLCGQTELFTADALRKLAEDYRVVIAGKSCLSGRDKHIVTYRTSVMDEQFQQLFDVYSFQTIFYVSGYADGGNGLFGEIQQLERVMTGCRNSRADKAVIITTGDSRNYLPRHGAAGELLKKDYYNNRTFGAGQVEEAVDYYREGLKIKTVVLQCPYLADRINEHNFLGRVFQNLYEKEKVLFPYHREDPVDFLSMDDLTELMLLLTEETEDESAVYDVVSGYHYTYGDLEDMLKLAAPDGKIVYENYPYMAKMPEYPERLRKRYGFIPMDNVMENIGSFYRVYLREVVKRNRGLWGKAASFLEKAGKGALKYIELVLFFIIAEFISRYTSDSIYFRFVDVRLFYILIMGTIYGMRTGLIAALLECAVLVRGYMFMGINGTILFYNIENWIPFVIYLMTGSITGYISNKKNDAFAFLRREYELLRDKYLFLNDVYHGAVEN